MKNIIMEKINELGEDACVWVNENVIHLDFNDWDGFDDDWCEVMRSYDHPELVEAMLEFLTNNAKEVDEDFYSTYTFDDCQVIVGYDSYNI